MSSPEHVVNRATRWQHLGLCNGADVRLFFESYEEDSVIAEQVDQICDGCPVQRVCLASGTSRNETGVWGGVYLVDGRPSPEFNRHKVSSPSRARIELVRIVKSIMEGS